MPAIDLSILNQRQTPAFYADVFANRPAAGFVGRIFVSTNTFAFYRDNGTSWDLIGGPGTGTVTGTGANGQVTFWNGASTITGSNDLFWDATNGHLGVNTNVPGTALDVHHDQPTVAILNQTVATNDTRIGFQNNGVGLWRIGSFYSGGSNDFKVNDAVLNINRFTIKSSSGQTFVGDEVTSSGLFVVNSSSSDAHIVALGASAPSIRVRNAGVGASLQFGLGLATTTNNFIQGATGGEFCIFNDSLTAQPILFGIKDAGLGNTQEAARISPARNFLIGTTTDAGQKLQVSGSGFLSGSLTTSGITCNGNLGIGLSNPDVIGYGTGNILGILGQAGNPANIQMGIVGTAGATTTPVGDLNFFGFNGGTSVVARTIIRGSLDGAINSTKFDFFTMNSGSIATRMTLNSSGNVGIGLTPSAWSSSSKALQIGSSAAPYLALFQQTTSTSDGYLGWGAYLTGDRTLAYTTTGDPVSVYRLNSGNHVWLSAPSGTVGNTITFTQSMTLGSTGNLLIGTTTDAGQKLQVNGTATITGILTGNNDVNLESNESYINLFSTYSVGMNRRARIRAVGAGGGSGYGGDFRVSTRATNNAWNDDAFVVTYAGNVLIGTSSNGGSKLRIVGLPTSAAGLSSGDIYSNAGILTIVP